MIVNKCEHEWTKHTDASQRIDVGAIPAYYICEKCKTLMTAPEVFQLESLEN
jgi:transcriptional regulator NrdR family protein